MFIVVIEQKQQLENIEAMFSSYAPYLEQIKVLLWGRLYLPPSCHMWLYAPIVRASSKLQCGGVVYM